MGPLPPITEGGGHRKHANLPYGHFCILPRPGMSCPAPNLKRRARFRSLY